MSEKSEKNLSAELWGALFAIQGELEGVEKDSVNPHFKNSYADRTTILQAVKPLLQKHGLLLIQAPTPSNEPGTLALQTSLIHVESGQAFVSVAVVPLPKSDPQGFGSALTYTSRYSLTAILGLPLLDDDGNAGSSLGSPRQTPAPTKKPEAKTSPKPKAATAPSAAAASSQQEPDANAPSASKTTPTSAASSNQTLQTGKRKLWGK